MTIEEVRDLFPAPEFTEAAEVLERINQSPGQFHEYSARLKLKLDDDARMLYARQEGRMEGEQHGELVGCISMLQELLAETSPTRADLLGYEIAQLTALHDELRQRFRLRSGQ